MSQKNNEVSSPEADFEAMLAAALGGSSHDDHARAIEDFEPDEAVPAGHKSGYVAVVGQPNVGKSTLMNHLLGEKLAIVSPKPQTTRINQLGIYSRDDVQIVFVDTPGIHQPQTELAVFMVEVAKSALEDADVVLFVVDISHLPNEADQFVASHLVGLRDQQKIVLVLNKVDLAKDPARLQTALNAYHELIPEAEILSTAAIDGYRVDELLQNILNRLPEGPRYYPKDQVSDVPLRGIAAEMIREQVLHKTYQEIPHSVAVLVNQFKRRENGIIYIEATIFTERDGQKGIIIGKKGAMLKSIGADARQEIEKFLGNRIYLDLQVKVLPDWRNNEKALQRFGYRL